MGALADRIGRRPLILLALAWLPETRPVRRALHGLR
jgi:MFS family permease